MNVVKLRRELSRNDVEVLVRKKLRRYFHVQTTQVEEALSNLHARDFLISTKPYVSSYEHAWIATRPPATNRP